MDGMRQATYSIPSDAIRECINAIDDCAQWLSCHLSEDALLRQAHSGNDGQQRRPVVLTLLARCVCDNNVQEM